MAKKKAGHDVDRKDAQAVRLAKLANPDAIAGIPGPGRWLVIEYRPTTLFSLKISLATSSVGKTLVVPTPYSVKMAFVDAAFRVGLSDEECVEFLSWLSMVEVRIAPPSRAVVTHTFIKVRQESRDSDPLRPYISSIAYREVAHHQGTWRWAFDLAAGDVKLAERLVCTAPHVNYIGKRGSFIQFSGISRQIELGPAFTQPIQDEKPWTLAQRIHIVALDDFGPEADMATLSSYTGKSPRREKHRRFVDTIVPLGLVNTGPGFSEYSAE